MHGVVYRFNGARVHVFVVHLSPNNFGLFPLDQFVSLADERYASRASEAARLEDIIAPLAEPVIMLCDCNLTDTSQAYVRLATFLRDSFREAGWGFGHTLIHPPYHFRTQRLDYVWHNDKFVAAQAAVGRAGNSDHLPITARLILADLP
ncbi:MAG TPA: endonuclease/exonuclease/phosphatase family protein [Anaerolineales bacterium]|nr:endonuclease/exonuclease/phosphatase family protein [Anaerolineales bacterium]